MGGNGECDRPGPLEPPPLGGDGGGHEKAWDSTGQHTKARYGAKDRLTPPSHLEVNGAGGGQALCGVVMLYGIITWRGGIDGVSCRAMVWHEAHDQKMQGKVTLYMVFSTLVASYWYYRGVYRAL